MSKLPLNARKNIKDNEEKHKAHLDSIKEVLALGPDINFDPQYTEINEWCGKNGYENRCADIVEWVLGGFAANIKKIFSEEIAKRSLNAAWTTGNLKIVMAPRPKGKNGYHASQVENGELIITCYNEGAASNVSNVGNDLLGQLKDDTGISVQAAQDVQKYEEDRNQFCSEIKDFTGLTADVAVEIEWGPWFEFFDKLGYKDRGSEVLKWYTDALKANFKKFFADDLAKSAIQSTWTSGVVKCSARDKTKTEKGHHKVSFDNGDLVIEAFSCSNLSEVGKEVPDLLKDASGLSLKAAQDVAKHLESREAFCTEAKDVVHQPADINIEVEWGNWCDFFDKLNYKDRPGEILKWFTDALLATFKKLFGGDANEVPRHALNAVWTTGIIKFSAREKTKTDKGYHKVKIENGDLLVETLSCSNLGDLGKDMWDALLDPDTNLPLRSVVCFNATAEKRNTILEGIKDAIQLNSDVTLELDRPTFEADCKVCGYENRGGDVAEWILEALLGNLKTICKEELTREAIQEVWTTGVLKIDKGDDKQKSYHGCSFQDGHLVIVYKPKSIASNVSSCGKDIEAQL